MEQPEGVAEIRATLSDVKDVRFVPLNSIWLANIVPGSSEWILVNEKSPLNQRGPQLSLLSVVCHLLLSGAWLVAVCISYLFPCCSK